MANVYDFDGTILDGDTEYLLFHYIYNSPKISDEVKEFISDIIKMDTTHFFDCCSHYFYAFKSIENFDELLEEFWDENEHLIKSYYKKTHRKDDIVSSASPEMIVAPMMRRLGITRFIGTELDENWHLKRYNKSYGKVKLLFEKYPDTVIETFYSDSDNDLPLAELAKNAIKVTGDVLEPWDFSVNKNYRPESQYVTEIEMKDDSFKIFNLSDLKINVKNLEDGSFKKSCDMIKELIKKAKPDLITLSGDQTYSGNKFVIESLCDFLDQFGIPFAPIFGNHDNLVDIKKFNYPARTQILVYQKYKNCLVKEGPRQLGNYSNGYECFGNYVIKLMKNGQEVRNLVFVNSGDHLDSKNTLENNAKLSDKQVEFIKHFSTTVPSTLFMHIPPFLFSIASKDYAVSCPPTNDFVFERLEGTKLDSIIAGHGNLNGAVTNYNEISLVSALKSTLVNEEIGGTLIEIKMGEKPTFDSIYLKIKSNN